MKIKITAALLSFAIVALSAALPAVAQDQSNKTDATQQEKDQETKGRIYGTKHPWENTLPYGTQFTPPAGSSGSTSETDASDSATKADQAKTPVKSKKTTSKKHTTARKRTITKTHRKTTTKKQ